MPAATMDVPATLRQRPASSSLTAEACQPTASVGSISLDHPTNNVWNVSSAVGDIV